MTEDNQIQSVLVADNHSFYSGSQALCTSRNRVSMDDKYNICPGDSIFDFMV